MVEKPCPHCGQSEPAQELRRPTCPQCAQAERLEGCSHDLRRSSCVQCGQGDRLESLTHDLRRLKKLMGQLQEELRTGLGSVNTQQAALRKRVDRLDEVLHEGAQQQGSVEDRLSDIEGRQESNTKSIEAFTASFAELGSEVASWPAAAKMQHALEQLETVEVLGQRTKELEAAVAKCQAATDLSCLQGREGLQAIGELRAALGQGCRQDVERLAATQLPASANSDDPRRWSESQLGLWLVDRGLPVGIARTFEAHLVNGLVAADLTEADVASMGISDPFHQRRVVREIRLLLESASAAVPSSPPMASGHRLSCASSCDTVSTNGLGAAIPRRPPIRPQSAPLRPQLPPQGHAGQRPPPRHLVHQGRRLQPPSTSVSPRQCGWLCECGRCPGRRA
mmetsp:Transcript_73824/g.238599  ORF Transcript_73824/g.238599 Transcript_73824/m.238599 type:complete len:395 (+) Transcript_73824:2-1186(+)